MSDQEEARATAAVSPSEYLQPAASSVQDSQPSPLALLAATCSKIGPPAVETAVTPPAPQPAPRRLVPIKPAPLKPGTVSLTSNKNNFNILSSKGNVVQIQGSQIGACYNGGQLVFTIQNPGMLNKGTRSSASIQYQGVPQIQTVGQAVQVQQNVGSQIQIIPGTNQAVIAPASTTQKPVPIKPAPVQKVNLGSTLQNAANLVKLAGGNNVALALPVNNLINTGDTGTQAQIIAESSAVISTSTKPKKSRKKIVPIVASSQGENLTVAEQVETVLIETTADNIIQAGNNLLIVQSPGSGQPAVVQQVQVVQPKPEPQVVQIPQQALRVVQAASATLPTVPQKPSQNIQIQNPDPVPTQIYIKTPSGELQSVLLQEAPAVTTASSTLSSSSSASTVQRTTQAGGSRKSTSTQRKERTLPKIAPAGGIINLNAAQLAAAAQAVQTININGVQVQGVPVTITNAGGQQQLTIQGISGNNLSISGLNPSQIQLQMEQALTGEIQPQPGEKRRRMACTCPNCKDGEKRLLEQGRKKHICHIPGCGKTFRKTSLLRAHVRLHTGERPFVCNWVFCGKRFTRSDELQRHARTHTGDKRFECLQCQKRFMRSDHLTKHYKTHLVTKNL